MRYLACAVVCTLLRLAFAGGGSMESGKLELPRGSNPNPGQVVELPRMFVDTSMPVQSGMVRRVSVCTQLQKTLDDAALGDTIVIDASLICPGEFTLPEKTSGSGWVVIQTSALDKFAPEGTRVNPARHAQYMPKILGKINNSSPFVARARAHHYRFIGIEMGMAPGMATQGGILSLAPRPAGANSIEDLPHHFIVDRCYIHGQPEKNTRRGIWVGADNVGIIDSYISEIHEVGSDSQAICGWNFRGPLKIVNNFLEASGENVMFGGAPRVIEGVVPSDIEISRNHFFKPLRWRVRDTSYAGQHWSVKNLLEFKNAQRVLVEGNVFENNWAHAQAGFAIVITPRVEWPSRSVPQAVTSDITIRYNIVRHSGSGFNILGRDQGTDSDQAQRILIQNNLITDIKGIKWGGQGRLFQILAGVPDLTIEHNTCMQAAGPIVMADGRPPSRGFVFRNNITAIGAGILGSGTSPGFATFDRYFPDFLFTHNVMVGPGARSYPGKNFFVGDWEKVKFIDLAAGDYRLAASSTYRKAASDGRDPGADIDALEKATEGVVVNVKPPAQ